ncbi:MCE family protein [Nocardioides litoris]|uniref:MCE family protein n=1 Tax=Nocardioides litoris TaxID=1926648 RepID=UPI001123ACE1|nr:MCE family protein [Nocardioides litoris]
MTARSVVRRGRAGLLAALAGSLLAGGLSGCDFDGAYDLPLPGSPVDADEAYEVRAEFADILNVVPRSPVMVDDVTVGEVTEVERVGWHAEVVLRVRDDVVLPDNAVAEIRQVSLLGEKYVALEAPAGATATGRLGDSPDDVIPLARTGRNPEVEEVLGALSFLLSGGGVAQLGTITRELNAAMDGRQDDLRSLLGNLDRFVGTLDGQKRDIIRALDSLNGLTATLNRSRRTIEEALDVTGPAIDVLGRQTDELVGMLSALDRLGVVGTRVINASRDDLLAQLRDLAPIVRNLAAAGDQLAPGLNLLVSFPFPKEASEIVLGDYANTAIRADISLENFLPKGGLLPDLPGLPDLPDLPVVGPALDKVLSCLRSGTLGSAACTAVLRSATLLPELVLRCAGVKWGRSGVCRALGPVEGLLDGLGVTGGGGSGGGGGGLLDLPGLGRLTTALSSGDPAPRADTSSLLGGGAR